MDKGQLAVNIEDAGMRLPAEGLGEFWSTFVHVIRNAVDHGLESPRERRAAGKPEVGVLTLSTRGEESMLAVRVADDGRGIDWSSVSAVARAQGLPAATRQDLEQAIFSDGLSTKGGASELSGRGVGLAAVRAVVSPMGGSIRVESTAGQGTAFTFLLPLLKLQPI